MTAQKNTAKLILTHGLPGSGKSTWAKKQVDENCIRVNLDDIRMELYGETYMRPVGQQEKAVKKLQRERVFTALREGQTVIVDDTNLGLRTARSWINVAREMRVAIEHVYFDVDVEECKRRNRLRDRSVPETVYDLMGEHIREDNKTVKRLYTDEKGLILRR